MERAEQAVEATEQGRRTFLIADDHPLVRTAIRYLVEELPFELEIHEAGDYQAAMALLDTHRFDMVLLDLMMPGPAPADALRAIIAKAPDTRVVVISVIDSPDQIRDAILAGAAGFIPKNSQSEVILRALGLILSGGKYLPPALINSLRPRLDRQAGQPPCAVQLTERQKEILTELAFGRPNKQIAHALNLSNATVKAHITAIMKSLGATNRTQAVIVAKEMGLV